MIDSALIARREMIPGVALAGIGAAVPASAQSSESIAALKAMLDSYDKAFSAHDLAGVMNLFAPNAVLLGTGPGEIWSGTAEFSETYKHFFAMFDKGKQSHESLFRDGNVLGDMAWLVSMSKVSLTKGSTTSEFGLNTLVVFEKTGGKWLVRAMHFSNLAPSQVAKK